MARADGPRTTEVRARGASVYETKCYNPLKQSTVLGRGSRAHGGAPSTNEGHRIAFGCTAEQLHYEVHGCKPRGFATDPPFNHSTGAGYVRAHAGYYSDAHAKGHSVVLLLTEALGGLHGTAVRQLRALHRRATRPRADDRTTYGSSRTATASFHTHWLRVISLSIASSLALAITERAESLGVQLIDDPPPSAGD